MSPLSNDWLLKVGCHPGVVGHCFPTGQAQCKGTTVGGLWMTDFWVEIHEDLLWIPFVEKKTKTPIFYIDICWKQWKMIQERHQPYLWMFLFVGKLSFELGWSKVSETQNGNGFMALGKNLVPLPALMTGAWEGREYGLKRQGSRNVWKMHVGWNRCFSKNYINLSLDFWSRKSWHVFPCFFCVLFPFEDDTARFWQHFFFHLTLGMKWMDFLSQGLLEKFQVFSFFCHPGILHICTWTTPNKRMIQKLNLCDIGSL